MKEGRQTAPAKATFEAINGMRGFAAIAVFMFHASRLLPWPVFTSAYLAVDIFFVLSGIVIAHAYNARLEAGMGVWRFLQLRLIRFLPFYYVGLILGTSVVIVAVILGASAAIPWWQIPIAFISSLFMAPTPISFIEDGALMFPLNPPGWSLFFELVVNIGYALVAKWRRVRLIAAGAMVCFSLPFLLAMDQIILGPLGRDFIFGLARTCFSFGVGVLIYHFPLKLRVPTAIPIAVAMLLLLLPAPEGFRAIYDSVCVIVVFPAVAALLLAASTAPSVFNGVYRYLGDASYGLYATHHPSLWVAKAVMDFGFLPGIPLAFGLLVVMVVGCTETERRVDGPLRRHLQRKWVRSDRPAGNSERLLA